jgi:hypothetical protein
VRGRSGGDSSATTASWAARPTRWYPDLIQYNQTCEQPYTPEEGYHLSRDLVDRAIGHIRDGVQVAPEKPWFI